MNSKITKALIALAVAGAAASCNTGKNTATADKPLSVLMAQSEMKRVPNTANLDFRTSLRWNYSTGLELFSFIKVAERYGCKDIFNYVYSYADTMIDATGAIFDYDTAEYNIDHVNAGKLLFDLYDETHEERFRKASDLLRAQMRTHPRTSEGGFWHKKVYPHQMWLDGLYMGAPFVAEYGRRNGEDVAADMISQFIIVARHTYDDSTRLYRHGWDESRQMHWADSATGRSRHAWGRANGWYMMAMADILEIVPDTTPGRDSVLCIFRNLAQNLLDYRDSTTGVWYQVLDQPYREGNYLESSCSSMFAYAYLKGARLGFLPAEFDSIGRRVYDDVVSRFIRHNDDGTVSLTDGCAVAGLGGKNMRDGSFEYYIGEAVRDNDPKAIGPFVLASLEMEQRCQGRCNRK